MPKLACAHAKRANGLCRQRRRQLGVSFRDGQLAPCRTQGGVVALDGERELAFDAGDRVRITLRDNAFPTVDVARCMHLAAELGLLRSSLPR